MKSSKISHLLVCAILIVSTIQAKPTIEKSQDDDDSSSSSVIPLEEAPQVPSGGNDLVPVGFVSETVGGGDDMETANTRYYPEYYYFRPVYSYRRLQSHRRRVYSPRRRVGYDSGDRFPTVI